MNAAILKLPVAKTSAAATVPAAVVPPAAATGVPSAGPMVDSQAAVPLAVVEMQEPNRIRGPLLTQPGSVLWPHSAQERTEPTLAEQQLQVRSKQAAPPRRVRIDPLDREVRFVDELHREVVPESQVWDDPDDPAEFDPIRVAELTERMQLAQACRKAAELESASYKIRLAQTEQRIQLLVEHQDELARDKTTLDEERRSLRKQTDMQHQRLIIFQADIERYKTEAEGQNMLIVQLTDAQSADYESTCHERSSWRTRETELQQKVGRLRRELEDFKRRGKVEQARATTVQFEESSQLQLHVQRLQDQAAADAVRVEEAQTHQVQLEIEWTEMQAHEKMLLQESAKKRREMSKAMEESRAREEELHDMLHELQDGLLEGDDEFPAIDS
jgi:hypothetical protein